MPNYPRVTYDLGVTKLEVRASPRGIRAFPRLSWLLKHIPLTTGETFGINVKVSVKRGEEVPEKIALRCDFHTQDGIPKLVVAETYDEFPISFEVAGEYLAASGEYRYDMTIEMPAIAKARKGICDYDVLSKDKIVWAFLTILMAGGVAYVVARLSS